MKYIEPSTPVAIRPRNSAPASKLHIRTPALSAADAAVLVLAAFGAPLTTGVGVIVAIGVGQGTAVHVATSTSTPTTTVWLLTPELLAWIQVHPAVPIV